jgi:Tfp pilus assembly protein FimT
MRKKSGFTVVELLVTLLFLSIVIVMVAQIGPSVTANARFTGMMNNFQADYSAAKLLASAENRYVAVIFSTDGHSYSIQKQTDILNFNNWTLVKTVTPFTDQVFNAGDLSSFAVNSTGEVQAYPIPNPLGAPSNIELKFYIEVKGKKTYSRTIKIFPYGGFKIEKN